MGQVTRPPQTVSGLSETWRGALASMTRGADMRAVLVRSLALATASTLFAFPYFHYLIFIVLDGCRLPGGLDPWGLLFTQLFLLSIACLLSAMVGFSFTKRFKLPGFGDWQHFVRAIPVLLVLAAGMITLSYFFFDRRFVEISPVSYPKDLLYIISIPFKEAFTEEIILRFCLVTLAIGLLKSKKAGVVFVSALASLFTIKYFHFIGIKVGLNYFFITQLLLSFSANLLLGYLFVTRGLLFNMALRFLFGMKYALVSCAIG